MRRKRDVAAGVPLVADFKVYADGKHAYRVLITKTISGMREMGKRLGPYRAKSEDAFTVANPSHSGRLFGYIVIPAKRVSGGVVAHEMAHAVLRYQVHIIYDMKEFALDEEKIAEIVGIMTSEFWSKYGDTKK